MKPYRGLITELLIKRKLLEDEVVDLQEKTGQLESLLTDQEEAGELIKAATSRTQAQFQISVSSIVTFALASVFDKPYTFTTTFVPRRNNVECDLRFNRKGHAIRPLSGGGFGAADIASLALRLAFRNLTSTRPVMIFDEMFRNLSRDHHVLAVKVVRELVDQLGLQLILITHIPEIMDISDKNFHVKLVSGGASVEEI